MNPSGHGPEHPAVATTNVQECGRWIQSQAPDHTTATAVLLSWLCQVAAQNYHGRWIQPASLQPPHGRYHCRQAYKQHCKSPPRHQCPPARAANHHRACKDPTKESPDLAIGGGQHHHEAHHHRDREWRSLVAALHTTTGLRWRSDNGEEEGMGEVGANGVELGFARATRDGWRPTYEIWVYQCSCYPMWESLTESQERKRKALDPSPTVKSRLGWDRRSTMPTLLQWLAHLKSWLGRLHTPARPGFSHRCQTTSFGMGPIYTSSSPPLLAADTLHFHLKASRP
jgi:hypothetical protein